MDQRPTRRLRELLAAKTMIVAPGAYDCFTAMMIARGGFPVVYMTGSGTALSLGLPDYGLVTMTEMSGNAGKIAAATGLPVIADADTGYGNELNVVRTVREYERLGVAGIHIEDQTFPKRCGHLDGKEVISLDDYVRKIRAAVSARKDPDFLIIARTDARADHGLEEAVARVNMALAEGADMAFVEAPLTLEEIEVVPKLVNGPCLFNLVRGGKSPLVDLATAERFGYSIVILAGLLMKGIVGTCERLLAEVRQTGESPSTPGDITTREMARRVNSDAWDELRHRFST